MKRFALPLVIGLLCAALPVPAAADYLGAGRHEFRFDGRDLASGTYICRLSTPWATETYKIELIR